MPCYKVEALLPRCLDSLLAQTLEGIEIVAVNDGSPDGCLSLLRDYESRHPQVIRVVDKRNGGLWRARWSGTDVATGDYVTYVDSDDYVTPSFARDLYETAVREDADIVVCGFQRIDELTGEPISTEMSEPRESFLAHDDPGRLVSINSAAWNKCYRRDLLMRMRRLDEPPAILEDVMLNQLAFLAARRPVAFTGTAPYRYLIRGGSMINSITTEQIETVKRALLEVKGAFGEQGAPADLVRELDATAFLHMGVSMSFRLSNVPGIDLPAQIADTTRFLDEHFPSWRRSPFIRPSYALRNGGAYVKLLLAQWFYRAHLMPPFLRLYNLLISKTGRDIKW